MLTQKGTNKQTGVSNSEDHDLKALYDANVVTEGSEDKASGSQHGFIETTFSEETAQDTNLVMEPLVEEIDLAIQSESVQAIICIKQVVIEPSTVGLSKHAPFLLNLNPRSIHVIKVREQVCHGLHDEVQGDSNNYRNAGCSDSSLRIRMKAVTSEFLS